MKTVVVLFAITLLPIAASAATVVNDSTWSTPVANTKVGGSSGLSYWGSAGTGGNLSLTGPSTDLLTLATGANGRGLLLNFAPQTLTSVGDVLSASFTFQVINPLTPGNDNNLRIALHNIGTGTEMTSNNYTNTNVAFVGYNGYMAAASIGRNDSTPSQIYRKVTTGDSIIGSATAGTQFDSLGAGGVNDPPTPLLTTGTDYTLELTLTRLASGVNIALSLSGGAVGTFFDFNVNDETSPTFTFTTAVFHVNSNLWDQSQLQNVNVTFTPVPEPSTWAMLLGGMAGAGGWILRRRRRI